MDKTVRVRFAPSPTGNLHVGGARTAIFNYCFARHHRGAFILRIEDTDRERFDPRARKEIFDSLDWLGLEIDEGPRQGGDCGPYIQSQRMDHYRSAVNRLLDSGRAYRCFCSRERLQNLRAEQKTKQSDTLGYDRHCLHLTPQEVQRNLAEDLPFVVRYRIPDRKEISFTDLIRGTITYQCRELDDIVLLKSDGYPTYHLANVVDDFRMGITHVMRGEEWISSAPKHVLLYSALQQPLPRFAHLPVILSEDGGKLSKRKGAASVMEYRDGGFLPEALFNFLSLLGWSPGDDTEIMTREEIVKRFSINRVTARAAVLDRQKLEWLNGHYLRQRTTRSILPFVRTALETGPLKETDISDHYLEEVIGLLKDRSKTLRQLAQAAICFFQDPEEYDPKTARKRFKAETADILRNLIDRLQGLDDFSARSIEELYRRTAEEIGLSAGKLIHPTRLALSGMGFGPGLFEMMELLGRDTVLRRLGKAVDWLNTQGRTES